MPAITEKIDKIPQCSNFPKLNSLKSAFRNREYVVSGPFFVVEENLKWLLNN